MDLLAHLSDAQVHDHLTHAPMRELEEYLAVATLHLWFVTYGYA